MGRGSGRHALYSAETRNQCCEWVPALPTGLNWHKKRLKCVFGDLNKNIFQYSVEIFFY